MRCYFRREGYVFRICGLRRDCRSCSGSVFRPAANRSCSALAENALPSREPLNTQRVSWSMNVAPVIRPVSLRRRQRSICRSRSRSRSSVSSIVSSRGFPDAVSRQFV